jgi:hypothetical protein
MGFAQRPQNPGLMGRLGGRWWGDSASNGDRIRTLRTQLVGERVGTCQEPPRTSQEEGWSLTSLQQRLFKTGGRLSRHSRYFILQLAESYLTPTLFRQILERIEGLGWHPRDREPHSRSGADEQRGSMCRKG